MRHPVLVQSDHTLCVHDTSMNSRAAQAARLSFCCMLFALLCLSLGACSASRTSELGRDATILLKPSTQGDFSKRISLGDASWAKRVDEAQVRLAIKHYSEAVTLSTPNLSKSERRARIAQVWTRLARAHYLLADSHLWHNTDESKRSALMKQQHNEGIVAAENALVLLAPAFTARVTEDPDAWRKGLAKLPDEALPSMYWYEANLEKWAMLSGIQTVLARQHDMRATMEALQARAPTFDEGGPDRLLGLLHTELPARAGDPVKSLAAFKRSIDLSPNFFATRILMAQYLATLRKDQPMFEKQLNLVVSTPASTLPAYEPENILEQRKAKALLAQTTQLFYQLPD